MSFAQRLGTVHEALQDIAGDAASEADEGTLDYEVYEAIEAAAAAAFEAIMKCPKEEKA